MMAERLQDSCRVPHGLHALVVHLETAGVEVEQPDAQTARLGAHLVDVGAGGCRSDDGVPGARPLRNVEHERSVANRARHAELHAETALVTQRPCGDAALAGLEPDEPAARCRDTDRAAAVARMRDRDHPCGNRCGGPTGRTAGRVVGVPGVPRDPERERFGARQASPLRARPASDDRQARSLEALHEPGARCRDMCGGLERPVAVRDGVACVVGPEVLEEERDPTQRADGRRAVACPGDCPVEPPQVHGVQFRVQLLDALGSGNRRLCRCEVTPPD